MRRAGFALVLVNVLVLNLLASGCAAANGDAAPGPRATINFDADWRFVKRDVPEAKEVSFDDADWTTVSCPHTYNDVDTFDDYSLAGHRGEQNQFGGRTWDRKAFSAPKAWQGKKIFITLQAGRRDAPLD